MSAFMRTAWCFRWPWQRIGLAPPLVSISTFDSSSFVSMRTDAMCAMWIVSSCPRGSAQIRQLVDEGFQAFNAGRLSEACAIFSEKMLDPGQDTTIGLTIAGAMTPAGLGGCVIEMMDRGLVDFIISTGANLYHDLHYALNFTLRRGSPFLDDVQLYEDGVIRIYDVLFPATVLLETDAYIRDFIVRSGLNEPIATSEFHYRLGLDLLP